MNPCNCWPFWIYVAILDFVSHFLIQPILFIILYILTDFPGIGYSLFNCLYNRKHIQGGL